MSLGALPGIRRITDSAARQETSWAGALRIRLGGSPSLGFGARTAPLRGRQMLQWLLVSVWLCCHAEIRDTRIL